MRLRIQLKPGRGAAGLILSLTLLGASAPADRAGADPVDELERQVTELERRLAELERPAPRAPARGATGKFEKGDAARVDPATAAYEELRDPEAGICAGIGDGVHSWVRSNGAEAGDGVLWSDVKNQEQMAAQPLAYRLDYKGTVWAILRMKDAAAARAYFAEFVHPPERMRTRSPDVHLKVETGETRLLEWERNAPSTDGLHRVQATALEIYREQFILVVTRYDWRKGAAPEFQADFDRLLEKMKGLIDVRFPR